MLTDLPWGGRISSFNGWAARGDSVRIIGGISGVVSGRVYQINANAPGGWQGKILVDFNPGQTTQAGDIGAAVIRVSDNAVLGTHGGRVSINGVWRARITHVNNY